MSQNILLRVTQINAIYLDKEIDKLFLQIIQEATKNLPPGLIAPYDEEIKLLVKLAILNYSIVKQGSTFGQQLLSVKYDNIPIYKRYLYVIGSTLGYIKDKCEIWKPSHEINRHISLVYTILKFLDFINLSVFLRNGVKPLLIERILGLNQVYSRDNVRRHYESKYLARELLWNGFIEMIVHILPLINYHKIKRTIKNNNPFRQKPVYSSISTREMTMHSKCAYCGENPTLPHHMGCAHIFCYVCLKGNQMADSKYECPICEHKNPNILCDRVAVI
ncbi:peroxisome biogenesis factor 2 [Aethina tumida]|uniref:peroxisome biogenesis factor 2 n=1 Tax=Aethina tumida TaxID=116153 RepID=UPI0021485F34|nr:peroxisome biogenesis factor 2 [Aethina tumida]